MAYSRVDMMQQEGRKRTHRILIGIILATLPCYFCGIILLFTFSGRTPATTGLTQTAFAGSASPEVTNTPGPSPTITPTYTPGGPTVTLPFTPTQFVPASDTPTPTDTPTATDTPQPTNTPRPNNKATQTANALLTQGAGELTQTAIAKKATATPQPADTDTPAPVPTDTPAGPPTDTPVPVPTDTPVPPPTSTP